MKLCIIHPVFQMGISKAEYLNKVLISFGLTNFFLLKYEITSKIVPVITVGFAFPIVCVSFPYIG
jgi:hypothetical protein